ncbi:hypothetical protein [Rhodohalobacter sulfatireducens]|uniref:DUF3137 domain-containing protein n=1 Tax=Rhodohalobacter sulfatireducens TaxID=2911366 RepID=A0ABS9K867_9BACT|nr:hypothetical protein [Rhodohalobacter sulfatireducens]MCG2586983.1 hypothetical protein [Rhodohalobacter sulfatireducens]
MLNKIKHALKKLSSWKPSFDPSKFDDEMALKTEWEPLKRGGTNFQTHKLVEVNYMRIEFRSTMGAKLFSLIFFTIGVGMPIFFGREMLHEVADIYQSDFIFIILFGLIFATVGGWLFYSFSKPVIFDKTLGFYWKGWKKPKRYMAKMEEEISSRIGNIYALQIIPELVRSDNKSYVSYELNLVLRDGSRMNVVDHGSPVKIRDDAKKLAEFLDVPVWDASME